MKVADCGGKSDHSSAGRPRGYTLSSLYRLCYYTTVAAGALVRQARQAAGLTQVQLARRLGTSQPVVARLERRDANPTWETLMRALRATGHDIQLTPVPQPRGELDLDQLRERLAMPPGERLRTFQASQQSLERLKARARRRDR